jgi:nucleotide-binding universal stress UspA family protein
VTQATARRRAREQTGGMADDVTTPGPASPESEGARGNGADMAATRPVLAALDGSDADDAVITWAADEAVRTNRPLRLLHVIEPGYQLTPYDSVFGQLPGLSEQLHSAGRAIVVAGADRAADGRPDLPVEHVVEWGPPAAAVVEHSDESAWVVVGAPPRRRLERVVLGSVALAVVAHARCPVAVVPSGHPVTPPRRVVVGIDGSPPSARAAELAFATAAPLGGQVTCVVGWSVEVIDGVVVTEPGTERWQEVENRYGLLVHEVVDPVAGRHPDVDVDVLVRPGGAARAVLDTAAERGADLVVIGTRGRGGFSELLLGSVSRRVVEHADTVVAVAH